MATTPKKARFAGASFASAKQAKDSLNERESEVKQSPRGMCGTPGCMLPDWHSGLCMRDCTTRSGSCGKRKPRPKAVFDPTLNREPQVKHYKRNSATVLADELEGELEDDGPPPVWVQCDRCAKWRLLVGTQTIDEANAWFCEMNPNEEANTCDAPETSACRDKDPRLSSDLFYVHHILDERPAALRGPLCKGGGMEYLVRWLGWSPEHDSWEPECNIADKSLIADFHQRQVTQATDVIPAAWAFVAECESIGGRGLFARGALQPGQAICEYGGPRLPLSLQTRDGKYVLRLPGTKIVVDGNCDNLPGELPPYECPRYSAIFANHSSTPNARMEYWPAPASNEHELSGSMWLVAKEPIAIGQEIRFDYEGGAAEEEAGGSGGAEDSARYWAEYVDVPSEGNWRDVRVLPPRRSPVPPGTKPALHVLDAIRDAAELSHKRRVQYRHCFPSAITQALRQIHAQPIERLPTAQADARICALTPLLARSDNPRTWGLLSTHVPGWSGRECRARWAAMGKTSALQDQGEQHEQGGRARDATGRILARMQ